LIAFIVPAIVSVPVSGQGLFRRLGERIRDTAPAPYPGPQRAAAARAPVARPNATRQTAPRTSTARRASRSATPNVPKERGNYKPATDPKDLIPDRTAAVTVPRPTARLGLQIETPAPRLVPGRGPLPQRGVAVLGTEDGLGAHAAGLLPGDRIVAMDGRVVNDVDDFIAQLTDYSPDDEMELKYIRDGQLNETTMKLSPIGVRTAATDATDPFDRLDVEQAGMVAELPAPRADLAPSLKPRAGVEPDADAMPPERGIGDLFSKGFDDFASDQSEGVVDDREPVAKTLPEPVIDPGLEVRLLRQELDRLRQKVRRLESRQ